MRLRSEGLSGSTVQREKQSDYEPGRVRHVIWLVVQKVDGSGIVISHL